MNDLNFLKIEKFIIMGKNKNINGHQLDYELNFYGRYYTNNYYVFTNILNDILLSLKNLDQFSEEKIYLFNLLELNKKLLKEYDINYCYFKYTAELITNWILLSFNTNLIDKTFFDKSDLYFNRYECIDKFSTYFNNYLIIYDNEFTNKLFIINKFKHLAFTIFTILVKNKFLIKMVKKFKINKIVKNKLIKGVKTFIFYKLCNYSLYDNIIDYNIYINKPNLIFIKNNYYFIGLHYSTLYKIFKVNKKSNKKFELGDLKILEKFISLEYRIDFDMYNLIEKLIYEDLNLDTNMDIKEYIISNLQNHYNTKFYEFEEVSNLKNFQRNYSKYLLYYIFTDIKYKLKYIDLFYLVVNFDFRGRIYPRSCISPVGHSIFRYLFFYGYYTADELINIQLENLEQINFFNYDVQLLKKFSKINLDNKLHYKYFYICIFEIGKIFKNLILEEKNGCLNEKDFIFLGINISNKIENNQIKLTFEEKLEYFHIISGLISLNENKYKKLIIYKDSTASGIQLLASVLGCINSKFINYCNLNSTEFWYDTYYFIIDMFFEKYKTNIITLDLKNPIKEYINRKFLKNSIMTYIYGAGEKLSEKYYLDSLSKNLDKLVGSIIFKLFYKFLIELFDSTEFFKNSISTITDNCKKSFLKNKEINILTIDDSKVPLDYYLVINYRLDRRIKGERNTILYSTLSEIYDEQKTLRSAPANLAQSLDALYVRLIIKKLDKSIITIHDCFGIDIFNIDSLIEVANYCINNINYSFDLQISKNYKNYYSKYILI